MDSSESKILDDFKTELTKRLYKEDTLSFDIAEWITSYKRMHPQASSRNVRRAVERHFKVKLNQNE